MNRHSKEGFKARREAKLNRTRSFNGQTDYKDLEPTTRNYEKAHLKAYLKGRPIFRYGRRPVFLEYPNGDKKKIGSEAIWHKVK